MTNIDVRQWLGGDLRVCKCKHAQTSSIWVVLLDENSKCGISLG